MKANTSYIARLIYKFLRGQETSEERDSIDHWRKSDKSNDNLIESFREAKNIQPDLNLFDSLDEDGAWRNVRRSAVEEKKNYWPLFRIAAVFVAIVGTIIFFVSQKEKQVVNDSAKYSVAKEDLLPAQSGALLVLADGSIMPLENSNKTLIQKLLL